MSNNPKCLFSKSADSINTAIIVTTELGKLTIHISDTELNRPISDVYDTVNDLLNGMKNISDAFGIDIKSALSNSDLMSLSTDESTKETESINKKESRPRIAKQNNDSQKQESINQDDDGGEDDVESFRKTQKIAENVSVTSPNGRNFQVPTKIKDATGDTTITIDTKSAENFQRINKNIEHNSYADGYNIEFRQCKLCYDNKSKTSTGYVRGVTCSKCGGSGEIMVG